MEHNEELSFPEKLISISLWCQKNYFVPCLLFTFFYTLGFFALLGSYFIGLYANALAGTKFDLSSIWQGFSIIVGGFTSVIFTGIAGYIKNLADNKKYQIDSEYNTATGVAPQPQTVAQATSLGTIFKAVATAHNDNE